MLLRRNQGVAYSSQAGIGAGMLAFGVEAGQSFMLGLLGFVLAPHGTRGIDA